MTTMKTLAMAVALVASAGAQAVTFDFTCYGANGCNEASYSPTFTKTVGGITVTVTPGSAGDSTPRVWQDSKGLGVSDTDFRGELDYNYNSVHNGEWLQFGFSQQVTIGTLGLEDWVDNSDRTQVSFGGGTAGAGSFIIGPAEGTAVDGIDLFNLAISGSISWLRVTPQTNTGSGETDFYVQRLGNVNAYTPPPAVPVPAAAWMMGSALVGLSAVARRRRT
jgi:hypothetical protein